MNCERTLRMICTYLGHAEANIGFDESEVMGYIKDAKAAIDKYDLEHNLGLINEYNRSKEDTENANAIIIAEGG